jgi:hypothetical protein
MILDRDVERRPNIERVLNHTWFKGLPGEIILDTCPREVDRISSKVINLKEHSKVDIIEIATD